MKKLIIASALLFSLSVNAQSKEKKDTTVQVTMTLDQFKSLIVTIDKNVDSKSVSNALIDFLYKSTQVVADKPKESIKPKN
jgi:hypothetical protein